MTANLTLWAMSFKGLAHLNCFCQPKGKKSAIMAVAKVHYFIKWTKATMIPNFTMRILISSPPLPWSHDSLLWQLPSLSESEWSSSLPSPRMRRYTPASGAFWADQHALLVHDCCPAIVAFAFARSWYSSTLYSIIYSCVWGLLSRAISMLY